MTDRARQLLDHIDEFFCTADSKSVETVWDILTAQRNTDFDNNSKEVKDRVTVHIRRASFPKLAAKIRSREIANNTGGIFETQKSFNIDCLSNNHFGHHAVRALKALELLVSNWDMPTTIRDYSTKQFTQSYTMKW